MMRLIFIALLVTLTYRLYRLAFSSSRKEVPKKEKPASLEGRVIHPREMVACASCKTYVAKGEAVQYRGDFFCENCKK